MELDTVYAIEFSPSEEAISFITVIKMFEYNVASFLCGKFHNRVPLTFAEGEKEAWDICLRLEKSLVKFPFHERRRTFVTRCEIEWLRYTWPGVIVLQFSPSQNRFSVEPLDQILVENLLHFQNGRMGDWVPLFLTDKESKMQEKFEGFKELHQRREI